MALCQGEPGGCQGQEGDGEEVCYTVMQRSAGAGFRDLVNIACVAWAVTVR